MASKRTMTLFAGLVTGGALAAIYVLAAAYLPIFNPDLSGLPIIRDHPLLEISAAATAARAIPLSMLMFFLAAMVSRLLKVSAPSFALGSIIGWLVALFLVM